MSFHYPRPPEQWTLFLYLQNTAKSRKRRKMWLVHILLLGELKMHTVQKQGFSWCGSTPSTYLRNSVSQPVTLSDFCSALNWIELNVGHFCPTHPSTLQKFHIFSSFENFRKKLQRPGPQTTLWRKIVFHVKHKTYQNKGSKRVLRGNRNV